MRAVPANGFVVYLENHDQVANRPLGARLVDCATSGRLRAMTAYLLIGPATPLIFQGQELGARTPFVFFADHPPDLARAVLKGRRAFLARFPDLATPEAQASIDDPADPATFAKCKLDPSLADSKTVALFTDLLALRRSERALAQERADRLAGAVIGPEAFALHFFSKEADAFSSKEEDRLLVVNLGSALRLEHAPAPLLLPPRSDGWRLLWSSDDERYGGAGVAAIETDDGWCVPAHAAVLLG
jgi:maltooligosyltrehalose trehalohydrolase